MIELIPNWHPVLVHFTVALLALAVTMHWLTLLPLPPVLRADWKIVARWLLWLGALFAIATAVTGWLAYNSVEHDDVSHAAMLEHRNWALITLGLFLSVAAWSVWSYWRNRQSVAANWFFSLALAVGAILLTSTAWHGAELVYRYGLGVMSMPNSARPAESDHAHVEADKTPVTPAATKPPVHDHSTHQH